ncbi:MAG: methanogen output domain 1-containing protein [Candidatus Helarchaeota archaeon]
MKEQQLKFIASVFRMAVKELYNVMGPESIQTIFRLIGEGQGERIHRVLSKKYKKDNWDPKEYTEKVIKEIIIPTLDEENVNYNIDGNVITIKLRQCPFQRAGMNITNKLYCTYTEGMIETAFKKAVPNSKFSTESLKAERAQNCIFKIKF